MVLLGTVAHENIVVWEGLDPGGFADRETPGLGRVVMDVIVTVLGDMRGNSTGGTATYLDLKSICKRASTFNPGIAVIGKKVLGYFSVKLGTDRFSCIGRPPLVSLHISFHVRPCFMIKKQA